MSTLYIRYPTASGSAGSFPLLAPDGSAAAPSYANSTGKTGIYFGAGEVLDFSTNQTKAGSISASQIWTIGAAGSTSFQNIIGSLTVSQSGDAVFNAVSTAANQNAICDLQSLNASVSGGAYLLTRRLSGTDSAWAVGIDVANTDQFVIANGTTLAATKYLTIQKTNGAVAIKGTATNNSASAGFYGEYVESVVSSPTNVGTSATWTNMTSISLTAGDWDVRAGQQSYVGVGAFTDGQWAISINSGATTSDQIQGVNQIGFSGPATGFNRGGYIGPYRISLSATTTVYLKSEIGYSSTTPQWTGILSARRIR